MSSSKLIAQRHVSYEKEKAFKELQHIIDNNKKNDIDLNSVYLSVKFSSLNLEQDALCTQ